jgi:glyoxylase-like metal-dependent hydrolase (beta-lactamase superfamily II)
MSMHIEPFYDARTNTLTYVVADLSTHDAVVIDPVLDYDPVGSKVFTESADRVIGWLLARELTLHAIMETHAHADHLSGARYIKARYPEAQIVIGARITEVQQVFKAVFDLPADFPTDGRQFDKLLEDGEVFQAGTLKFETIFTPGHTPACASYKIGDAIFTGDALFMPDQGTGRCDFPAGSARALYRAITERIYTLPDPTRVFVGHDYQPGDRPVRWETTVGDEKNDNVQLPAHLSEADFVRRREARDKLLAAPKLLYQSVQVNIDAGRLPRSGAEKRYLRIPVNVFRPEGEGALSLDCI